MTRRTLLPVALAAGGVLGLALAGPASAQSRTTPAARPPAAASLQDLQAQIARLQAEVDRLRAQVQRLQAAPPRVTLRATPVPEGRVYITPPDLNYGPLPAPNAPAPNAPATPRSNIPESRVIPLGGIGG